MVDDANPPDPWIVFSTGLVGMLCFQLLAPVGWALGNRYMRICLRRGLEPDPLARMGRAFGMVGTLFWGSLGFISLVVFLVSYAWSR